MRLAEKLVSLRKQKGLTQMELAERLDVSRQAVSRWEVGSSVPSTDNLRTLSEIYGVSLDYLLRDGIEDLVDDSQYQYQESKGWEIKKAYRNILMCLLSVVVTLATVGAIYLTAIQGADQGKSTPIGELDNQNENYSNQGTFIIE